MKKAKFTASFLVITMIMMMFATTMVSAADTEANTAKVTIQNDTGTTGTSISGVAFSLYRIFDLVITDATDDEAENITYSVNSNYIDFFDEYLTMSYEEYLADDVTYLSDDAAIIAYNDAALEYVNNCKTYNEDGSVLSNTMADLVADLRLYILDNTDTIQPVTTTGTTATNSNGVESITSEEVAYGYYLIMDADGVAAEDGIVPAGSLITVPGRSTTDGTLTADVIVVMKGSMPTMEKEVWHNDADNLDGDVSPTYGGSGAWDVVSDYQIGDTIEYRITATIPSDLRGYTNETYTYQITDTLSEGLVINQDSLSIYTSPLLTSASEVEGGYHETTFGTTADEPTFTIDFEMYNIVEDPALNGIEVFYIYYTATVTEDAAIALDYETNTATLTYSNNPYDSESYGQIEDTVYTYTFDLDILKTSGDGVSPLEGAKFALYEVSGEASGNQTITQIYLTLDTDSPLDGVQTYYPSAGSASNATGIITTNVSGEFDIVGLDDATTYMLKEIEAPEGYNAIDPITFIIHATYTEVNGVPVPTITSTGTDFNTDGSGLFGTIINTSNQLLPSTGGSGTVLFTVIGCIMMFSAVVLIIVKRRKY